MVNFEKLRMIAKEIRHVGRMAAVNMDPALMFRTRWVLLSRLVFWVFTTLAKSIVSSI